MAAGLRERANIWKISYGNDDIVGGAVTTGTIQYANIMCRMDAKMPSQILLQQGLETQKTWTAMVIPGTMDIQERDEFQPIFPYNHPYLNQRFRIVGVTRSDNLNFNPNGYIVLSLVHSDIAHGIN